MIVQLDEAKRRLGELRADVDDLASALRIDELRAKAKEYDEMTSDNAFWADAEKSAKILQDAKRVKDKIEKWETLSNKVDETLELDQMAIDENDESFTDEILADVKDIETTAAAMRIEVLLSGEYDDSNAIIALHPGAGGTEAQDWALMLYRMYCRWGEKHNFNVKLVDYLDGEEAGIKSATIMIEGTNAYGYLKSENGVHRLVRVSPFDASGRRQTSFASVEVMPEFKDNGSIEIRDEEIEVTTHKSSGAGGQHINKTESAVRIVHKPTGIVVGCQTERSQLQNKEYALRLLKSKLMEIQRREHLDRVEDIQGTKTNIEWGNQIRSYVFMPYTLVKDVRTGFEVGDVWAVMDGELDGFINAYLKANAQN